MLKLSVERANEKERGVCSALDE